MDEDGVHISEEDVREIEKPLSLFASSNIDLMKYLIF
jgi:hypothetical protein